MPVPRDCQGKALDVPRPTWADSPDSGVWDGARQAADGVAIDFKTKCENGARGVLSVSPSPGKCWVPGRAPWEASLVELSKELLEAIGGPRVVKGIRRAPRPRGNSNQQPVVEAINPPTQADIAKLQQNINADGEVAQLTKMLNMNRAHQWNTWNNVGLCLKNESLKTGVDYLPLWDEFSRKSSKYTPGECKRVWEDMKHKTHGALGMGSLHYWAEKDDPKGYIQVLVHGANVRMCNGSHNDVARIASKIMLGKFVCTESNGSLWYYFDGNLWLTDPDGLQTRCALSHTVHDIFLDQAYKVAKESASVCDDTQSVASSIMGNSDAKNSAKILFKTAMNLQNCGFKECVMKELREYMYDKDFRNRIDSNPNLIAFKNGVWELREKRFRQATPEDYVCLNVGYEYTPEDTEENKAKIGHYWRTLHPEEEQRIYMKQMFSRQLYGDNGNNLFHFHAGRGATAANGKSNFFEILQLAVGEDGVGYSCKFEVSVLTSDRKDKQGKAVPELAEWRGVRFLYCSEPNADETINSGVMKTITGGESIKFRKLYSSHIQTFRPMHKLHLMCNDTPNVDGTDSGVKRRIVKVDYISHFVPAADADPTIHKYALDTSLGQSFRESMGLRMAFLRELLLEYDHNFDFKPPMSVRDSSRMFIEENDSVFGFVKECIVPEKGAWFTLAQAKEVFKSTEYYKNKITTLKTDLEKALGVKRFEQKWMISKNEKNVFLDHKLSWQSSADTVVTFHPVVDDPLEPRGGGVV